MILTIVGAPLVLGAIGFTASGVAAGSIAAAIQSAAYGGFTTGVFSNFQSAGASGLSLTSNLVVGGTVGGTVYTHLPGDPESSENDENEEDETP